MPSNTYKASGIVLKKTKLAEKDLIVEFLAEDGSLLKAVAKGARKPGGSLAARMEPFTTVDLMLARGRSLDVVTEARMAGRPGPGMQDLEKTACAAPVAELLRAIAQQGLPGPRLFDMARSAFAHICEAEGGRQLLSLCAASLWKVLAQSGFRPSFTTCSVCGSAVAAEGLGRKVPVSVADGGVVCGACPRPADALIVDASSVQWCEAFIRMRFDEVAQAPAGLRSATDALHLARLWTRVHVGAPLKSLDFLLTLDLS